MLTYLGRRIATLDDIDVKDKRILVRVDINSPVNSKTGDLLDVSRLVEHSITIKELVDRGAAVTVIGHQGRPLDQDFVSLENHAKALTKLLGVDVMFVDDVIGPEARKAIEKLKPGDVLLLENTRIISEENVEASPEVHVKSFLVSKLAPLFSYFINDAFATCHRSQASIVGFPLRLPSVAGRVMEKELKALIKIMDLEERPRVFVLGGAKLDDTVKVIKYIVESGVADEVLTTGLVAVLFLVAKGVKVPKDVEERVSSKAPKETLNTARELVVRHKSIKIPIDFTVEEGGLISVAHATTLKGVPKDIGPSTVEYYVNKLLKAKIIVMRGPAGVVEDPRFRIGTESLIKAALESNAYTVFGGGHFISMLSNIPEDVKSKVGHVSTAGGALLYFLSGEKMPCLEALVKSNELFKVVS